jgi:hypothetical protein
MTPDEILAVLDACCDSFTFPMLDNGYVYPAAARLSAHRSADQWAIAIETFGYSPREGFPSLTVQTFGSSIANRKSPTSYITTEAHQKYLAANPFNEFRSEYPFDESDWLDPDDGELVAEGARHALLRGKPFSIPEPVVYGKLGIELLQFPRVHVFEFCRAAAELRRDDVLATPDERSFNIPADFKELLVLDEWNHPNVVLDTERPSGSEAFQQIARVLVTGDVSYYRPSQLPNTHWKNWPEGGSL